VDTEEACEGRRIVWANNENLAAVVNGTGIASRCFVRLVGEKDECVANSAIVVASLRSPVAVVVVVVAVVIVAVAVVVMAVLVLGDDARAEASS
jgi:hypothetical protein